MLDKKTVLTFLAGLSLVVLAGVLANIAYVTLLSVFPLPPNAKDYQGTITTGMSTISAFVTAFFLYLLNRPKEPAKSDTQTAPQPEVPRNAINPTALSPEERLKHHQQRHELYKKAYLDQKTLIKAVQSELAEAKSASERHALRADRYLLHRSLFVVATLFSVWQLASGFLGAAIYKYFAVTREAAQIPLAAEFAQSILMCLMAPLVAGWVVAHYRRTCGNVSRRFAVLIAFGGIWLSGAVFFLNLSPESIPTLMGAETPIRFADGSRMPLLVWLMLLRGLVLPLVALVGAAFFITWNSPRLPSSNPNLIQGNALAEPAPAPAPAT